MESPSDPLDDCTSVNATILEYYNRFGRDRRLEKYLRLRVPIPSTDEEPIATPAQVAAASTVTKETEEAAIAGDQQELPAIVIETVTDSSQTDFDALDESQQLDESKLSRISKKSERRLEWDSLGDVGYNVQHSTNSAHSDPNIKSLESDILKKLAKQSTTEIAAKQKQNWQRTLESIKQKYDSQLMDVSELGSVPFHTASFSDKSTPKPPPPQQLPVVPRKMQGDKSIQTSFRDLSSKKVQVSLGRGSETSSVSSMSTPAVLKQSKLSSFTTSQSGTSIQTSFRDLSSKKVQVSLGRGSETSSVSSMSTPAVLKQSKLSSFTTSQSGTSRDDGTSTTAGRMPNDLELGINLLCTLIESKNLSTRKKKLLARKIVSKISRKDSVSADSRRSTPSTTNSDQLNNSSSKANTDSSAGDVNANNAPSKISSTTTEELMKSRESKQTSVTTTSSSGMETQRQAKQKPKARSSSESMSAWLDPMTKSEFRYEKYHQPGVVLVNKKATGDFVPATKSPTPAAEPIAIDVNAGGDFIPICTRRRPSEILNFLTNERRAHLNWIENEVQHLENLKQLLLSDIKRTDFVPFNSRNVYDDVARSSALSTGRSSTRSAAKQIEAASENQPKIPPADRNEVVYDDVADTGQRHPVKSQSLDIPEEKRLPKRNCHSVDRHAEKQFRSKLETPTICPNDTIAAFVRSRKQQFLERCKKTYSDPSTDNGGHYSEPCEKSETKQKPSGSEPCTSTTSSNFFVSSESMSVPEVTTSTTTTTHQYDHRAGVGIQTTESLLYTQKIVAPATDNGRPTIRTYGRGGRNKQTQTKPQSLAYVINFDDACPSGAAMEFTLRDHLERRRPDFLEHTTQRSLVLKKLHYLRKERDRQVREIVANTSISSIPRKLKELPPPPSRSTKILPSREMKAITKQKYCQLPEVVERMRRLKVEKGRKTNRILADVFNKRMQQRVRKGHLNLEHSMTVI